MIRPHPDASHPALASGSGFLLPSLGAGWFHTPEKNEDRLSYLAKESSLNAPHRTIKANTRPSESKRQKIFNMGNLSNESNGKLV